MKEEEKCSSHILKKNILTTKKNRLKVRVSESGVVRERKEKARLEINEKLESFA